jgi:hypothetical protein
MMAFILIVVMLTIAFVGWKGYVIGGRTACKNSDMILNEEFECEEKREPNIISNEIQIDFNVGGDLD